MRQVRAPVNDGDLTSFVGDCGRSMDADRRRREIPGRIDRAAVLRDREAFILLFLISIPLCCARRVPAPTQAMNSRSRMQRPVCFRRCCASGACPTICHTQPGMRLARVKSWFDAGASLHWATWRIILPPTAYTRGNLNGASPVCSRFRHRARLGGSSTTTSKIADFLLGHGPISTRTGAPMSPQHPA